jgi:osmoprotectant transport system permease protein
MGQLKMTGRRVNLPAGAITLISLCSLCFCSQFSIAADDAKPEIKIGSKKFTESVILGEMLAFLARDAGASAIHRAELGGSDILWKALLRGDIDIYPEYTGTLKAELLRGEPDIGQALADRGIRMSKSLGFNDSYALGMKTDLARDLGIRSISDLREHPDLKFGFSDEFMKRPDGLPSLKSRYHLPQQDVRGLDHDLAYRALHKGHIHVTDVYTTDAEVRYYKMRVLEDDQHIFPPYQAVLLYREDLERNAPQALASMLRLEGRISESAMMEMNERAKLKRVPESHVAAGFLSENLGLQIQTLDESWMHTLWRTTREHLTLVALSLLAAIAVAVPLGIAAVRYPRFGQIILSITGIIQTIPALALLVVLIPLLGIGAMPAIVALFLYSLLPIVRNTYAGLHDIPTPILESASALGLPPFARLRLVELPLAARSILAGTKTSAVINIGTATLGALIGAGGYGQPILTGIRLDDVSLILQGAIPAALLALLVQGLFELAERSIVPKGLRLKPESLA